MKKYTEGHGLTVIVNSLLPFKGFNYVNIFGRIWTRNENFIMTDDNAKHERIHTVQATDFIPGFMKRHLPVWLTDFIGYLIFYIWYGLEYVIKLIVSLFTDNLENIRRWAYKSVSFEQEAYYNSWDGDYLKGRKRFAWLPFVSAMFKKNNIPEVRK